MIVQRFRRTRVGRLATLERFAFAVAIAGALIVTTNAQNQRPAPKATPRGEETALLAQGWAALAAGDPAVAAQAADAVLLKIPGSAAAAALRVEAAITRAGSLAGLAAYESWLADRRLDDGYLLRRIARASLWELVAQTASATDALQELAADGDAEARAELARRMLAKGFVETRALARIGDEGAIKQLIGQIQTGEGSKMHQIDALVQSKSALAIDPLMKLLNDTNYPDHVAAAADGLGILNATQAVSHLQKIYQDYTNSPVQSVRTAAAFGLFRLGDMTGINLLQQKLASDTPYIALDAARRMASRPDAAWHQVVRGGLANPDPAVRIIAAELTATYDLEAARQSLETLLRDSNPAIRALAGKIMASRVAADFRTLRRFFRSEEWQIRLAATGRVLELSR